MPTARKRPPRVDSRLPLILDAAAAQFAAKGFQAASIRDIVASVGMHPGSIYCHFSTKDELLAAVYAEGVRRITQSVEAAVAQQDDPWGRLEAACVAHLEALLEEDSYASVVVSVSPATVPAAAPAMIALRDGYERLFVALVDALPLPPRSSRHALRLMLLGALNWTPTWFRRDGRQPPAKLARGFVRLLRTSASDPAAAQRP